MSGKFNLNDEVLVIVNQRGWEAIRKHFESLGLCQDAYIDRMRQLDGRLKMQIWEMMHFFGIDSFIGCGEPPIETNVEFVHPHPNADDPVTVDKKPA